MLDALLIIGALVGGPPADTTVAVAVGDRLVIQGLSGEVALVGWDQDAVEVVYDRSDGIVVRRSGSLVTVGSRGRRRSADVVVRVPRWMDVMVESRSLEVAAQGLGGTLDIRNVNGDVAVEDVAGALTIRSVNGEIVVMDARGGVTGSSQGDDVSLLRIAGPVEVRTGDGDVALVDVSSASVRAEALDGDVAFVGTIVDGGDYGFYVHDGDATIALNEDANATVHVSTFDGEFRSDFTVRVDRFTSGRQFDFVLGGGGARIEIEVFDGDISLVRRP